MKNVLLMEFKEYNDSRGSLVPIEHLKNLPFPIERIYYIYNVAKNEERGFHAHRELEEILICLGGTVKIRVKNHNSEEIITLDKPNEGLYIGKMIWREMFDFSENATLLVIASKKYNESDYIKDFKGYLYEAKQYFEEIELINNYTKGKNINLELVEEKDAEFLLKTRMNESLNKYLNPVNNSIEEQLNWIKNYKIKEYNKKEYYFKIIDKKQKDVGFVRLYNIDYDLQKLTFGSFILNDNKPKYAALEAMILAMKISFEYLKMEKVELDVRRENEHAKNFYNRFGFKKIRENEIDEFYELNKDEFEELFLNKYKSYIGG